MPQDELGTLGTLLIVLFIFIYIYILLQNLLFQLPEILYFRNKHLQNFYTLFKIFDMTKVRSYQFPNYVFFLHAGYLSPPF